MDINLHFSESGAVRREQRCRPLRVARCCPDLKIMIEQMPDDAAAEKAGPTEDGDDPPVSGLWRFQIWRQGAELPSSDQQKFTTGDGQPQTHLRGDAPLFGGLTRAEEVIE